MRVRLNLLASVGKRLFARLRFLILTFALWAGPEFWSAFIHFWPR